MVYQVEISSLADFPFWSGGKDTFDNIVAAGKIDELDELAETIFDGEEIPTDTAINDWMWFDSDDIYSRLGLDENGQLPPSEKEVEITWDPEDAEDGTINDDESIRDKIEDELYDIKKDYPYDFKYQKMSQSSSENGSVTVKYLVSDIEW